MKGKIFWIAVAMLVLIGQVSVLLAACGTPAGNTTSATDILVPSTDESTVYVDESTAGTEVDTTAATDKGFDAAALVAKMTAEEKVGQLFLARCPESDAAEDVSTYHLGGYILFGRDFRLGTKDSVKRNIAKYQAAAEIPLLIAVDEEGGTVTRVSRYLH